jgi:hypothetical protein
VKVSRIMWYAGTVFTTLVMLAAYTTAAAQQQAQTVHVRTPVDSTRAERQAAANLKAFRGVAALQSLGLSRTE